MKIAVIGYIFRGNKIIVSYDTVSDVFIIEEEYRDRELGITIGFSTITESKEEVRECLDSFKKDFNWNKHQK